LHRQRPSPFVNFSENQWAALMRQNHKIHNAVDLRTPNVVTGEPEQPKICR
jgi:hypothetical protein